MLYRFHRITFERRQGIFYQLFQKVLEATSINPGTCFVKFDVWNKIRKARGRDAKRICSEEAWNSNGREMKEFISRRKCPWHLIWSIVVHAFLVASALCVPVLVARLSRILPVTSKNRWALAGTWRSPRSWNNAAVYQESGGVVNASCVGWSPFKKQAGLIQHGWHVLLPVNQARAAVSYKVSSSVRRRWNAPDRSICPLALIQREFLLDIIGRPTDGVWVRLSWNGRFDGRSLRTSYKLSSRGLSNQLRLE